MEIIRDYSLAKQMILKWHYSGTAPVGTGYVGAVDGKPVMAIIFGSVSRQRWGMYKGVYELIRMVKEEGCSYQLTGFISKCLKLVRADFSAELVISYADPAQGHRGGVYRAASWNYHGKSVKGTVGFFIDGKYIHRRVLYNMYGTSSYKKLVGMGLKVEHVRSDGKHLYWKPLTLRGKFMARDMGLKNEIDIR